MKGTWISIAAALLAFAGTASETVATEAPSKGLCLVCQVTSGEAEEEPVRATWIHEGKEYGFCSEKCARAFEADPIAYVPPAFPRPAPPFAVEDLGGRAISSGSLEGKVVLLDFWATWCVPCRKSMPELQVLHKRYANRGFSVIGISIDEGGPAKVRKFVAAKKITYPIALDKEENPAWQAYRVKAIPAAYLIDREGRIVAQWTGVAVNGKELEEKLEVLLRVD